MRPSSADKVRNMRKDRKRRVQKQGGQKGAKAVVLGMLERGGAIRTAVLEDRTKKAMQPVVREHVEAGSTIYSDEFTSSWRMDDEYAHGVINHLEAYVDGQIHTNGLENFWSLLKRGLKGTYVSVEPFHLFRYVDEQAFRFNNRGPMNDADRFSYVIRKIVGKRLTYKELVGKEGETAEGATEEIPF
jgi:transposase-like protein